MKYFYEIKNYINKYKNVILFSSLFITIIGSFGFTYYIYYKNNNIEKEINEKISLKYEKQNEDKNLEENVINEIKYVYVDVKGYVKNPGVYKVEEGSRVNDVIVLAGGLIKNANTKYVNLSKKITDEMIINIISNQEVKDMIEAKKEINLVIDENKISTPDTSTPNDNEILININTANQEQLMELSGIGEAKAKAIIDYRVTSGVFSSIEDIMKVSGISESTFAKIKTFITV
jgi:competence protein ComEA